MELAKHLLSIILIMIPALFFGNEGKSVEMGLAIIAGGICTAFLNMDKVKRFKGAGFEAEMKAEVQKAVDEAYATIEQLRNLGKPLITAIIKIVVYNGRIGGLSNPEKHKLLEELNNISKSIIIGKNQEIIDTVKTFYRFITWDYYSAFIYELRRDFSEDHSFSTVYDQLQALYEFYTTDYPSKDQIITILGDYSSKLKPNANELLEDYIYYNNHQSLRREIDPYNE